MVRRGHRDTDKCPRCGQRDEHTEHVVLCNRQGTTNIFQTVVEEIDQWLTTSTTAEIREAVISLILEYRNGENNRDETNISEEVQNAKDRQTRIGLYPFMCGIFVLK